MRNDGACDQLGEKGDEAGIVKKGISRNLAPVGIHEEGNLLECKKTDSEGKHNVKKLELRGKNRVDGGEKEIHVLKINKNAKVRQNAQSDQPFTEGFPPVMLHQPIQYKVDQYAGQNNEQIACVKIPIEPQGHSQKKALRKMILFEMVQGKITDDAQRKKQKYENVRIK